MKKFSLTPSQYASLTIILGLVANAAYSSYDTGRIVWSKFVPALLVGVVGYCRSLSPTNSGGPADAKSAAAQAPADTSPTP